jgi:hypothetical protein
MIDLLEKYKDVIKHFRVERYDHEGESYRIKLEKTFINDSKLFFKEYLFDRGDRKYAFNWVDAAGEFLCRWDNAPHRPDVITFPYHKHIEGQVRASKETTLEEILKTIAGELKP